jgi:HKD family nuclease
VDQIDPYWDSLEIAVAWVRASGMGHVSPNLANFLRRGGRLSVTVGIDLSNTTREGLQALLNLEQLGQCETFVYHNEAGSTFHPKLYLFRNAEEARLIVGSNNLTEAGLFTNVEAGLQVDADNTAAVVLQAQDALASWRDTTNRLAIRLDQDVLAQLSDRGYVPDEAEAQRDSRRKLGNHERRRGPPLFGSRYYGPPSREGRQDVRVEGAEPERSSTEAGLSSGSVLLMRLRKAHAQDRPTQTQIPIRVMDTYFLGATSVRSSHTGAEHRISPASARGNVNTIKLEIPEMGPLAEPVARFEQTVEGISYEIYDASSPEGRQIMGALRTGIRDGTTQRTISDLERATWWKPI